MFGKSRIQARKEDLNLHEGKEQLITVHLSDLHLPFSNKRLPQVIRLVEEIDPELIFLTGDYFDFSTSIKVFESFISEIAQERTLFYILGNHDYRFKEEIELVFNKAYTCFNVDKNAIIYTSRNNFDYLISSWETRNQIQRIKNLSQIVLVHNPKNIIQEELPNFNLVLAGHLHGGQFVLKRFNDSRLFPGSLFYKYCFESKIINGTRIIVNKGLGDILPMRLNCPHEIVQIKIQ